MSINEAELIFNKYLGNHFQMAREGDYESYKVFNITKQQELIWIKNLINEYLQQPLSLNTSSNIVDLLFKQVENLNYIKYLNSLSNDIIATDDTFMKIVIAESINNKKEYIIKNQRKVLGFITVKNSSPVDVKFLENIISQLLLSAKNNTIKIKKQYITSEFMASLTTEEKIMNRIDNGLDRI